MASIVLTAVGTSLGGPIGAAIGFLAGEQISASTILGGGSREGPRIKDLAVTTSTYGQPLPRHFGSMRVPGTIIWSTDLIESRETSGGGKGKPKTTNYSYSASFAVALGSRPIHGVGRIWADGNLLRGAGGDLKSPGMMRLYQGHADQPVDPIIASAEGSDCPAFRGCAYIVFEDLALGDFGNRIPSLTFEVFADTTPNFSLAQLIDGEAGTATSSEIPNLRGFSDEGGPLRSSLRALEATFDLQCTDVSGSFELALEPDISRAASATFSALLGPTRDDGSPSTGTNRKRKEANSDRPSALRYYDQDRDYQPGVQRAAGRAEQGRERVLELAAAMTADGAKELVNLRSQRSQWIGEELTWRVAELDPSLGPGAVVRIPQIPGVWQIKDWEWSNEGVVLQLERIPPKSATGALGESGVRIPPLDQLPWPTRLEAFELPWDGISDPNAPALFAAATAGGANWRGATLFADQAGVLQPLGSEITQRAIIGDLSADLAPSPSILLEPTSYLELILDAPDLALASTTTEGLAAGRNRLLVGKEVLQFLKAEQISDYGWRLSGLLRGRAGTEEFALAGHSAGTRCVALDGGIVALDPAIVLASAEPIVAAIGFGDDEPVYAPLDTSGRSRSPLAPVHPVATPDGSGNWTFAWTRRSRGQWRWSDSVDIALIEESENYLIGFGNPSAPSRRWISPVAQFQLDAAEVTELVGQYGNGSLWVRQIGTYGQSAATLLANLSA